MTIYSAKSVFPILQTPKTHQKHDFCWIFREFSGLCIIFAAFNPCYVKIKFWPICNLFAEHQVFQNTYCGLDGYLL